MKHCMLMSVLSLLFSLLLPVTVQHAAGISGGEALPEVSPAASAAPESAALGEERADHPDDDHTHAPADEPESANGTDTGSCGNTSVTVTLDGSAYTLSGSDAVTLTAILENLDYDPQSVCNCLAEFTVETEVGTEYEVNLTEYFARCDAGQAALTQKQADAIREIVERLGE